MGALFLLCFSCLMFFVDASQFCFQFGAVFLPIYLLHFGAQACNLLHFGAYHFSHGFWHGFIDVYIVSIDCLYGVHRCSVVLFWMLFIDFKNTWLSSMFPWCSLICTCFSSILYMVFIVFYMILLLVFTWFSFLLPWRSLISACFSLLLQWFSLIFMQWKSTRLLKYHWAALICLRTWQSNLYLQNLGVH